MATRWGLPFLVFCGCWKNASALFMQAGSSSFAQIRWSIPVKLPWIFPGVPLNFDGAPGNIQGNLTGKWPSLVNCHMPSLSNCSTPLPIMNVVLGYFLLNILDFQVYFDIVLPEISGTISHSVDVCIQAVDFTCLENRISWYRLRVCKTEYLHVINVWVGTFYEICLVFFTT